MCSRGWVVDSEAILKRDCSRASAQVTTSITMFGVRMCSPPLKGFAMIVLRAKTVSAETREYVRLVPRRVFHPSSSVLKICNGIHQTASGHPKGKINFDEEKTSDEDCESI